VPKLTDILKHGTLLVTGAGARRPIEEREVAVSIDREGDDIVLRIIDHAASMVSVAVADDGGLITLAELRLNPTAAHRLMLNLYARRLTDAD
jgi:uncharacterized protein (DUF39 family)